MFLPSLFLGSGTRNETMQPSSKINLRLVLVILGALSVVTPFSIDMYLPAFSQMAADLNTTSSTVSLSLSSYFIGLALGQVIYGPLLDRFGRKRPLCTGLALFIATSIACLFVHDIQWLIALRFLQALGGGIAQTASVTMVHDFFPIESSAKIFSLLFLFIGVSPLLAPTVGSLVVVTFSWKCIFILLAGIVAAILAAVIFILPEGHKSDSTISLKPAGILAEYCIIIKQAVFYTYAFAGAFSFAGLFTYVAGSPIVFMENFHVSARIYGVIFATLAVGFIGGSQLNIFLLKRYSSEFLFLRAVMLQVAASVIFLIGLFGNWLTLVPTMILFFAFLLGAGISYPNAAALALARFTRNAGSASALLGFLQFGVGALISTGIGSFNAKSSTPIILIMAITSATGLMILLYGKTKIIPGEPIPGEDDAPLAQPTLMH